MLERQSPMGEIRHFRGPSRIVGRSVKLHNAIEYIGTYKDGDSYELSKLAELHFGARHDHANALSIIGLDPATTNGPLGEGRLPRIIVADNRAVLALCEGKTVTSIVTEQLGRAALRDAYHEPLYIDKSGMFIRPFTPQDQEDATTVWVNLRGAVHVANHSLEGVWVDTDWHWTPPIPQQRPQSA